MITIHKFMLSFEDEQTILMPADANVFHAGPDPWGTPCLWAEVHTRNVMKPVSVFLVDTGGEFPARPVRHVGSWAHGEYMRHIFVET